MVAGKERIGSSICAEDYPDCLRLAFRPCDFVGPHAPFSDLGPFLPGLEIRRDASVSRSLLNVQRKSSPTVRSWKQTVFQSRSLRRGP